MREDILATGHTTDTNPENCRDPDGSGRSRSNDQRRRLLVAALAGAPMIVAGSAQTAYAQGGGTKVTGALGSA
jgi:hypothetical protein